MLGDYGKMILLGMAMFLATAAGIALILADEALAGVSFMSTLMGAIVGYLTGNGVLASKGQAPSPVYVPTPDRITDHETETGVSYERTR